MVAMTINRTAQRSQSLQEWLDEKSEMFSALCGEGFTRMEVVKAHAFVVLVLLACGLAEWLEGGAL